MVQFKQLLDIIVHTSQLVTTRPLLSFRWFSLMYGIRQPSFCGVVDCCYNYFRPASANGVCCLGEFHQGWSKQQYHYRYSTRIPLINFITLIITRNNIVSNHQPHQLLIGRDSDCHLTRNIRESFLSSASKAPNWPYGDHLAVVFHSESPCHSQHDKKTSLTMNWTKTMSTTFLRPSRIELTIS